MQKRKVITNRERLGIPDPHVPIPKIEPDTWTKDIRCRFSTEMEHRLLVFYPETRALYNEWWTLIKSLSNNSCYWEGFNPNCHYGEFNFENDMPTINHYMVEFESDSVYTEIYAAFVAHFPQKHRPDMRLQYIHNDQFIKDARPFPVPYIATGFAKEFRTRYDMEMEAVYNILPGFSTPIPYWRSIHDKLKKLMILHDKQFGIDILRKFGASSIMVLQENTLSTEMFYHLDAACNWELNKWYEEHPEADI